MPVEIPSPDDVVDFPKDNPRLKIVRHKETLYVVERFYRWSPEKQRGVEDRTYVGKIRDGRFYTMEDYKRLFKRDGTPRTALTSGPAKGRPATPAKKRTVAKPVETRAEPENKSDAAAPEKASSSRCDALLAGETLLLDRIARRIGLREDLARVWGERAADAVISLATFFLTSDRNSVSLYEDWRRSHAAPSGARLTSEDVTALFEELGCRPNRQTDFFKARLERLDEDELFSYDATEIAAEALDIEDARDVMGKKTGIRRQVNLTLVFGRKSGLPVFFRVFPGDIPDVSTAPELLFQFKQLGDVRVSAAVLDGATFSEEKLVRFLRGGYSCLTAAQLDVAWVSDALEQVLPSLGSHLNRMSESIQGKTVPVDLEVGPADSHRVWVYVFRDRYRAIKEEAELFEDLAAFEAQWANCDDEAIARALEASDTLRFFEKPVGAPGTCRLVRNNEAVARMLDRTGLFASVSTTECPTQFALDTYGLRDNVEECFTAGKTDLTMDVLCARSTHTMEGRFIVSFAALTLLSEIRRRMAAPESVVVKDGRKKSLADEYTRTALMSHIASVKVICDGDECRFAEVTKRQHEIATRMGCPDLYAVVPSGFSNPH